MNQNDLDDKLRMARFNHYYQVGQALPFNTKEHMVKPVSEPTEQAESAPTIEQLAERASQAKATLAYQARRNVNGKTPVELAKMELEYQRAKKEALDAYAALDAAMKGSAGS